MLERSRAITWLEGRDGPFAVSCRPHQQTQHLSMPRKGCALLISYTTTNPITNFRVANIPSANKQRSHRPGSGFLLGCSFQRAISPAPLPAHLGEPNTSSAHHPVRLTWRRRGAPTRAGMPEEGHAVRDCRNEPPVGFKEAAFHGSLTAWFTLDILCVRLRCRWH